MNDRIPESPEVADETFWRRGGGFRWMLPRFDLVRPADTRPRCGFNRYPHNIIGVYAIVFGRCWGVRWKGSRR